MKISLCGILCSECDSLKSGECVGCTESGPKTDYCEKQCQIRLCAVGRPVSSCAECPEFDSCGIIGDLHSKYPELRQNLLNDKAQAGEAS